MPGEITVAVDPLSLPHIRISVGDFFETHDDVTISVHDGEKHYIAILPPDIFWHTVDRLQEWRGKPANDDYIYIALRNFTKYPPANAEEWQAMGSWCWIFHSGQGEGEKKEE